MVLESKEEQEVIRWNLLSLADPIDLLKKSKKKDSSSSSEEEKENRQNMLNLFSEPRVDVEKFLNMMHNYFYQQVRIEAKVLITYYHNT